MRILLVEDQGHAAINATTEIQSRFSCEVDRAADPLEAVALISIYQHVDMANKRTALEKVERELFSEDGDGSSRGRQRSRQSHFFDKITTFMSLPKQKPTSVGWVLALVDPARENWNCIFDCAESLCDRLDELDIESML